MNQRLQSAIEKAKQYALGDIPITHTPPQVPRVGTAGICDYCGKKCPVVVQTENKLFSVCWSDVCLLKDIHGTTWEVIVRPTLQRNLSKRLQTEAHNNHLKGETDANALPAL